MNHVYKRALSLLLVLLLFSALCLSVLATEPESTEPAYVTWEVSEDGETLTASDGRVFHRYYGERSLIIDTKTKYHYANTVTLPSDGFENAEICAPSRDSEHLWVYNDYGYGRIFATDAGAAALDAFIGGEISCFTITEDFYHTAVVEESLISDLESARLGGGETEVFPVAKLKDLPCYTIVATEATASLTYDFGAVYRYEEAYYYVNYYELDNSFFDSDGYFSYRKGSVTALRLDSALEGRIDESLLEAELYSRTDEWENDGIWDGSWDDEYYGDIEDATIVFYVLFVFIGYLLPTPFLVLGLTLPHSASRGRPRYWYSTAIIAGVWVVLATLLLIVLIL